MASMAISLQLKPKPQTIRNPSLIHFFSSSTTTSDPTIPNDNPQNNSSSSPSQSQPSFPFSDVKSKLDQPSPPPPPQQPRTPSSMDEIRQRLSQFRPTATPPHTPSSQPISFQGLYQKNMLRRGQEGGGSTTNETRGGGFSFDTIRENLKKIRPEHNPVGKSPNSLSRLRESNNSTVIGGSGALPASIFGREMNDKRDESPEMKIQYMRLYERDELGTKLRELRPKNLKEFSIKELNERLVKLREIEETETKEGGVTGAIMGELRRSLVQLQISDQKNEKINNVRRLEVLGQQTPSFMLLSPKEHLVEKYFHPDNMSSAEKLKIELQKVRDEFKMSETDCGSARVQVAQLTTKIKHLATALHKKDKHSRKGLQEMVQRRKKLLKYLRRTDWDSYCLVLSRLGLRDNPDYKAK